MEINLSINGNNIPLSGTNFTTTGFSLSGMPSTTSSVFINPQYSKEVHDVELINDEGLNFIDIIYKLIPNNYCGFYINNKPDRPKMSKERYGVVDGKLQLIKTTNGFEEPGYFVPPCIEWEE